jgi:hypothetical protein
LAASENSGRSPGREPQYTQIENSGFIPPSCLGMRARS